MKMTDLIIYNTDYGKSNAVLLVVDNEVWLTQSQLAERLTPLLKISTCISKIYYKTMN